METLLGVQHLTRRGDYTFNFDLQDGLHALGIAPMFCVQITVSVRGHLYRLAGLLMG
jgi:hypothetical protein